jgi:hypothetical protein
MISMVDATISLSPILLQNSLLFSECMKIARFQNKIYEDPTFNSYKQNIEKCMEGRYLRGSKQRQER